MAPLYYSIWQVCNVFMYMYQVALVAVNIITDSTALDMLKPPLHTALQACVCMYYIYMLLIMFCWSIMYNVTCMEAEGNCHADINARVYL